MTKLTVEFVWNVFSYLCLNFHKCLLEGYCSAVHFFYCLLLLEGGPKVNTLFVGVSTWLYVTRGNAISAISIVIVIGTKIKKRRRFFWYPMFFFKSRVFVGPWEVTHSVHGGALTYLRAFPLQSDGSIVFLNDTNGINVLGEIIESSEHSVNRRYYGQIHNDGHVLLSRITDPLSRYGVSDVTLLTDLRRRRNSLKNTVGVSSFFRRLHLEWWNTSRRPPEIRPSSVCTRGWTDSSSSTRTVWLLTQGTRWVLSCSPEFKKIENAPNYRPLRDLLVKNAVFVCPQLNFPGVVVEAVKVVGTCKASIPNLLVTYFDEFRIDLGNAVEWDEKTIVEYKVRRRSTSSNHNPEEKPGEKKQTISVDHPRPSFSYSSISVPFFFEGE